MNRISGFLCIFCAVAMNSRAGEADPRGPIEYPGMKVVADKTGVHAPGYPFMNNTRKPDPWQAEWIRMRDGTKSTTAMFRKEITLDAVPARVSAWMTADSIYRLYINGRLVSRGPVDIGYEYTVAAEKRDINEVSTKRWFYDYRDLTPYFTKGRNVITAEVFGKWRGDPSRVFARWHDAISRGNPGFLFEARITTADRKESTVKSDASWKAAPADQYPDSTTYDITKEPRGWRLAGFDDSAWPAAVEIANIWEPMIPSEMPPLMEASYPVLRVNGLSANRIVTSDSRFTVFFDRVLSAYPRLKVKGGKGARMEIRAHGALLVTLAGGEQFIEFPFMAEVAPSYTVTLKNVTEPLEILDAGATFTSQPVEYRGAFSCSDPKLNELWDVSRWTVQICLQTHHLDSPNHQEPLACHGDYMIEAMVSHHAFAQPWLARQDLRKSAWIYRNINYRNFHTSYSLAWLRMLMDYYDFTGDMALVEELAPYVHELLDTYTSWRGKNGLISEAPNYMFMDWVKINGIECHHPPAVIGQGYLTAFYYHGMELASRVATLTRDKARVEKYARLRREVANAFKRELWNAEKGLYRDGKPFQTTVKPHLWLPADTGIETFSPHVNLLAVLFNLAPKERHAPIVEKVLAEKPLNTQPWFMHWVFQSIDHAGLFDQYGTAQMRRWKVLRDTRSFLETWTKGDKSHGWCSTPLVQMSSRILGVSPASPGFRTITIRPQLCDLTWAKGIVPTPHGDVAVDWKLDGNKLSLDVTVPAGSEAEIILPTNRFAQPRVTLNGSPSAAKVRVKEGRSQLELTGIFIPKS
jgi:alpha-L-rhamnosidase